MSSIKEIIARVDLNKPNAFDEPRKLAWIAELDGWIALDILRMNITQVQQLLYTHPTDLERAPLLTFPHDGLYDLWLGAKIDFENGEYTKYQNTMEMFNAAYDNFNHWFIVTYEPAQRAAGDPWPPEPYATALAQGIANEEEK